MELPKKNKTLLIFITLAVLIIARVLISYFSEPADNLKTDSQQTMPNQLDQDSNIGTENNLLIPQDEDTAELLAKMENNCARIKEQYSSLSEVKNKYKIENLFFNVHKEIDGKVFRLRFFYKDGPNTEIPTYLVYEEDINEEELIIENTSHQKGPLYKKIEAAKGEILFTGEAYDLLGDQDLFLYYENNQIKDLQGAANFPDTGLTHLECRY